MKFLQKIFLFFMTTMIATASDDQIVTGELERLEQVERKKVHKIKFYDTLEAMVIEANLNNKRPLKNFLLKLSIKLFRKKLMLLEISQV